MTPVAAASRPDQVVLAPLPRVLVYDHCPYATRVRYALGAKNVKHEVTWLLNDDANTGKALVGKKIVPIFQADGPGGSAVAESMDIVTSVDGDARYGRPGLFRPASGRTDITNWFESLRQPIRRLTYPRCVRAQLPEFATRDARATFIKNHALPEPSDYAENIAMSAELLAEIQPKMQALDDLIYSPEFCTEGGLSLDDVDLFPRLRLLTLAKDLVMPEKMLAYLAHQSDMSDVATYHVFAQ